MAAARQPGMRRTDPCNKRTLEAGDLGSARGVVLATVIERRRANKLKTVVERRVELIW